MPIYDLTGLPYAEQLRWRAQRDTTHAVTAEAADAALPDWEPSTPASTTGTFTTNSPTLSPATETTGNRHSRPPFVAAR